MNKNGNHIQQRKMYGVNESHHNLKSNLSLLWQTPIPNSQPLPGKFNGNHAQRRKMYKLDDHHHNLKSKLQLHWLGSLQNPQPISDKLLKDKKHQQNSIRQYNSFIDRRAQHTQPPYNFQTIDTNPTNKSHQSSRVSRNNGNSIQMRNSRILDYNDSSLNQQLQGFNPQYISNSRYYSKPRVNTIDYDSGLSKQMNLRSALDRPNYYNNPIITTNDSVPYKNIIPDKLQTYLRPSVKQARRYY